jgi:hypothetical protein
VWICSLEPTNELFRDHSQLHSSESDFSRSAF